MRSIAKQRRIRRQNTYGVLIIFLGLLVAGFAIYVNLLRLEALV